MPLGTLPIPNNVEIAGTLYAARLIIAKGDAPIGDDAVQPGAGIDATKLKHQYLPVVGDKADETAAAWIRTLHVALGAGSVSGFWVAIKDEAVGDAEVEVVLLKNGVSVLTGVV